MRNQSYIVVRVSKWCVGACVCMQILYSKVLSLKFYFQTFLIREDYLFGSHIPENSIGVTVWGYHGSMHSNANEDSNTY